MPKFHKTLSKGIFTTEWFLPSMFMQWTGLVNTYLYSMWGLKETPFVSILVQDQIIEILHFSTWKLKEKVISIYIDVVKFYCMRLRPPDGITSSASNNLSMDQSTLRCAFCTSMSAVHVNLLGWAIWRYSISPLFLNFAHLLKLLHLVLHQSGIKNMFHRCCGDSSGQWSHMATGYENKWKVLLSQHWHWKKSGAGYSE